MVGCAGLTWLLRRLFWAEPHRKADCGRHLPHDNSRCALAPCLSQRSVLVGTESEDLVAVRKRAQP